MSKPVYGSATAAMSLSSRFVPQPLAPQPGTFCCQGSAVNRVLQPPPPAPSGDLSLRPTSSPGPLWFHTVSLERVPFSLRCREVPPTATTVGSDAGDSGRSGSAGGLFLFTSSQS